MQNHLPYLIFVAVMGLAAISSVLRTQPEVIKNSQDNSITSPVLLTAPPVSMETQKPKLQLQRRLPSNKYCREHPNAPGCKNGKPIGDPSDDEEEDPGLEVHHNDKPDPKYPNDNFPRMKHSFDWPEQEPGDEPYEKPKYLGLEHAKRINDAHVKSEKDWAYETEDGKKAMKAERYHNKDKGSRNRRYNVGSKLRRDRLNSKEELDRRHRSNFEEAVREAVKDEQDVWDFQTEENKKDEEWKKKWTSKEVKKKGSKVTNAFNNFFKKDPDVELAELAAKRAERRANPGAVLRMSKKQREKAAKEEARYKKLKHEKTMKQLVSDWTTGYIQHQKDKIEEKVRLTLNDELAKVVDIEYSWAYTAYMDQFEADNYLANQKRYNAEQDQLAHQPDEVDYSKNLPIRLFDENGVSQEPGFSKRLVYNERLGKFENKVVFNGHRTPDAQWKRKEDRHNSKFVNGRKSFKVRGGRPGQESDHDQKATYAHSIYANDPNDSDDSDEEDKDGTR